MGYSFSDFANDRDIKHIFHKVEPVTDALINKAVGKVQSLKTGGRVRGAKKGAPKLIKAHVGEYVVPVGIKIPKSIKSAVAKRKAKK
jgi:hypothetical protein